MVTYIGYEEFSAEITVTGPMVRNISLRQQSLGLDEVVVIAENSKSGTTSSKIRSEAISHVQASSLKDVLQLIPGNLSENPNLRDPSKITIREVGANVNSALGTAVIVDGIPLSNDGNMQQSISTGNAMTSVAGTGIDIRTIAVDNIESITVDVGIPSAEYGNLTSGAVHIKTKAGGSPFNVKFKADPRTKQGYLSKGFLLPEDHGVLNFDGDYTRSYGHIIKRTSLFNRVNGSLKYTQTFFRERSPLTLEAKGSYWSTLDGDKWDPDMLLLEENYSRDQNLGRRPFPLLVPEQALDLQPLLRRGILPHLAEGVRETVGRKFLGGYLLLHGHHRRGIPNQLRPFGILFRGDLRRKALYPLPEAESHRLPEAGIYDP